MSRRTDMSMRFIGDGSSFVRNAIAMDRSGNYDQAKQYYKQAAAKFNLALEQKDISLTNATKAKEYLDRCEARINEIEGMSSVPPHLQSSEGVAQAPRPCGKSGSCYSAGPGKNRGSRENFSRRSDDEDDEIERKISNAILVEKPDVRMCDVAGLDEAKRALNESVAFRFKFKQFFTGERSAYNNILLYGPPGTGKTFLAKAAAAEASSATFFTVSAADILSKWSGETEKLVRGLFDKARRESPAIIFIDEIDSFFSHPVRKELIYQMENIGKTMKDVLLLAATSIPWSFDPDTRRLFDKMIYVPLPDFEARRKIIETKLRKTPNNISCSQMDDIANITEGYSGSDIQILTREAAMTAVRIIQRAKYFREYEGQVYPCEPNEPGAKRMSMMDPDFPADKVSTPPVTFNCFWASIGRIRPSVSPSDLTRFEEWTREFNLNY